MTDYGRRKIEEAKKNGQWDAVQSPKISEEQIYTVASLLKKHEAAYTNFQAMSLSVKRPTRGHTMMQNRHWTRKAFVLDD